MLGTKGVDVGDACIGNAYNSNTCKMGIYIENTRIKVIYRRYTSIRDACISSIDSIKYLGIYLQLSQI